MDYRKIIKEIGRGKNHARDLDLDTARGLYTRMLGANPSMFAGTLLACDMGGFFLAKELAGGDVAAWLYSGLIL
ncbi:ethanolamine utilization protein EutH, partial [Salmonella enterica subsp. enterica serovar Muenster]|nr:ethanolamine utilization protein EutH [Salmonella enterica subsp. enterica serovar Muenster]